MNTRADVIAYITAQIAENTTGAITATKLNATLDYMVDRWFQDNEIKVTADGLTATDLKSALEELLAAISSAGGTMTGAEIVAALEALTGTDRLSGAKVDYDGTTSVNGVLGNLETRLNLTWDSEVTYGLGHIAIKSGVIYQSLNASNTNHQPPNETYWSVLSGESLTALQIVALLEALTGTDMLDGSKVYHTTTSVSVSQAIDGVQTDANKAQSDIDAHIADTSNPHNVAASDLAYSPGDDVAGALDMIFDELLINEGTWSAGTYDKNSIVQHNGSSYVATVETSEEPSDTATDWDLLAAKGYDGADGADGSGISWQGAWSAGTYNEFDGVGYLGSSWIANKTTTETPGLSATDWDLWVQKGEQGEQGIQGIQGVAGADGSDGADGADAPETIIQYSQDGSTGWTSTFHDESYVYIRFSTDGGSTWSSAAKFIGEGGAAITATSSDLDGVSSITPDFETNNLIIYENAAGPISLYEPENYSELDGVNVVVIIKPAYMQKAVIYAASYYGFDIKHIEYYQELKITFTYVDGVASVNAELIKVKPNLPYLPQIISTKNINVLDSPTAITITAIDTSGTYKVLTLSWLPYIDDFVNVIEGREWLVMKGTGGDYVRVYRYGKIIGVDYANKTITIDDELTHSTPSAFAVSDKVGFIGIKSGGWNFLGGRTSKIIDYTDCDYATEFVTGKGVYKHSDGTYRMIVAGRSSGNYAMGLFKSDNLKDWEQDGTGPRIPTTIEPSGITWIGDQTSVKKGYIMESFIWSETDSKYIGYGFAMNSKDNPLKFEIGCIKFDEDFNNIEWVEDALLDVSTMEKGYWHPHIFYFEGYYYLSITTVDTDVVNDTYVKVFRSTSPTSGFTFYQNVVSPLEFYGDLHVPINRHPTATELIEYENELYLLVAGYGYTNESMNNQNESICFYHLNRETGLFEFVKFGAIFTGIWVDYYDFTQSAQGHFGGFSSFYDRKSNKLYTYIDITEVTDDYNIVFTEKLLSKISGDFLTVNAAAFNANNTDGATFSQNESTTNKVNTSVFLFDQDTIQYVQLEFKNDGRITTNAMKVTLEALANSSDATNNSVAWRVRGLVRNPETVIDSDFGAAVQLNKAMPLHTKTYETAQGALTLGGDTISANSTIVIEIERYATDATNDTLDDLAGLVNVKLEINQ